MGWSIYGICCPGQVCLIVCLTCNFVHAWGDQTTRIWELWTKVLAIGKVLGYKKDQLMVFLDDWDIMLISVSKLLLQKNQCELFLWICYRQDGDSMWGLSIVCLLYHIRQSC
jgi:hypothetical protein